MLSRLAVSSFVVLVLISPGRGANPADFINFSHPSVPGRLYVPPEADPANPRPLILFLHGAGETGSNNGSQINGNIDNLLAGAKDYGAYLYAPQATTFTWADTTRTSTVMSMIDQALLDFDVDPSRLYVTGLSMGGGGVWNMLNRFDDRFAAGVPICGVTPGGDFDGANLAGMPTWAFHARDDGTVSPLSSRNVVNQVLSAASAPLVTFPATTERLSTVEYRNDIVGMNYTERPQGGHGIWGAVYNTPELYDWMFSKTLNSDPFPRVGGGQVIMNNASPYYPIGDQHGNAIPVRTGFAAVGTFDLHDAAISATNAQTLDLLASSFTQFGAAIELGIRSVPGAFFGNIGAGLVGSDPLVGENVFLVVGDGVDIQSSESLFVFKSNEMFSYDAFQINLAVNGDLTNGQILLGDHGLVAGGPGGIEPGIIAAAVNVPEPAVSALLVLSAIASCCTRGMGNRSIK
jgi:pimeloyl-ACP methyl ester carboxylesterase